MRGTTPIVYCDAEDGMCGTWDVDYYEATASRVNGVRITKTERAPGWRSTDEEDLCPEHADGQGDPDTPVGYDGQGAALYPHQVGDEAGDGR